MADRSERTAAAILLTEGDGAELRLYLVERAAELRFFGGYLALPGGVLEAEDRAAGDEAAALRQCALRELFEETGVLLGGDVPPDAQQAALRRDLLAGKEPSETRARAHDAWQRLATPERTGTFREICRIRTPPFAPVRYDTLFLQAALPPHAHPQVWSGELVAGSFWRPAQALAAWRRGEILIAPPVVILLELLENRTLEAFAAAAADLASRYRAGELHRVRFSPGVIMASIETPTLPPATTTNCYLVGEERLCIVDPGSPHVHEQERLFALIDSLLAEGRTLDSIVLTHHHRDHVGAVHAVSRRYELPVRGHPLTLGRLAAGFRAGAPLHDGDHIALGAAADGTPGLQLVASHTPGHDRGHHVYRETRYDAVLAGDMISTVSTIVIDPPEGHLGTYLQSLERLLAEPMTTLYPAHGPAARDGHRIVRQYLRHRAQRENALVAALAQGPATLEQLVPKVYWDVDRRMFPLAARSLLAGLAKLGEEGRARAQDGRYCLLVPPS